MAQDEQWITVQEAARRLGVKEDAIRKRIQRGTLRHEKDLKDGRVYVYLDGNKQTSQDTAYDATQDTTEDASYAALIDTLHEQVEYLRSVIDTRDRELESRTEELRRKDHIIAALTERIPAIEAPSETPSEASDSHETASEEPGGDEVGEEQEKRSWWRRLFGG